MIRLLKQEDIELVKVIWERYYKNEFSFEEFNNHFLSMFAVVDDQNRIISAGGLRTIVEVVLVTDKAFDRTKRYKALLQILEFSKFVAARNNYNEIHATSQDKSWESVLRKHDFTDLKGTFLRLGL